MKHYLLIPFTSVLMVLFLASARAQVPAPAYQLSIVTNRPESIYTIGEKAKFLVALQKGGEAVTEGEITYVLDKDGVPPATRGKLKAAKGGLVIEGTLAEPGFLRCSVIYFPAGAKQAISVVAEAGFDPLKISPSLPVPDDFDTFWTAQKARLAAVPLKPILTPVKNSPPGIECFDVQVPCVGPRPVSGYFARPAGAAPQSLPAILHVHGSGVGSSNLGASIGSARQHYLSLDINAHGIPNGKPAQFHQDLSAGELKGYYSLGREDREKCYFLGMFLRLVRALDFLTSQPEWDGKVLMVEGSSQGGGQSIAAAGLNPRVTFFAAGVPAMCDHSGKAVGRINGWPKLVPDKNGKPDPKILQAARYFDAMNFATRTKAEAIVSVGFIDADCPPTSIFAAYNNLQGKKQMVIEPLMGHASPPKIQKAFAEATAQHVAQRKGENK